MNVERSSLIRQALIARVNHKSDMAEALRVLNLNYHRPVIVVVGGADEAEGYDTVRKAAQAVAKSAEQTGAIIISGGTDSGVMAAMGQARAQGAYRFPLVGVAVEKLITQFDPTQEDIAPLEPHHTHFLLVPGDLWGDEAVWISYLATTLAGEETSVTVLSNGGAISLKDVIYSLKCRRPVVVLEGTGRLADELACILTSSNWMKIVPALDELAISKTINKFLLDKKRSF